MYFAGIKTLAKRYMRKSGFGIETTLFFCVKNYLIRWVVKR